MNCCSEIPCKGREENLIWFLKETSHFFVIFIYHVFHHDYKCDCITITAKGRCTLLKKKTKIDHIRAHIF